MGRYQYGGVNITGFQLVNYSSPFVKNFLRVWRKLDPGIWPGAAYNSIHVTICFSLYIVLFHILVVLGFKGGSRGAVVWSPPGKSQVAIGFLNKIVMDPPRETIGPYGVLLFLEACSYDPL